MHTIEPHAASEPMGEEPRGRTGPPDWLRIVLLLVLLGAVLGGMNWLIHSAPGPTSAVPTVTTVPTAVAAPIVLATRLPTPVPTPPPTAVPSAAPTMTALPTVAPTVAPVVAVALSSDWWNWSSGPMDPLEEDQALADLDHRWTSITQAWWSLSWQNLGDTETEPQLRAFTGLLKERRAEEKSQRVVVERGAATVHYLKDGVAVVYETYVNHSVAVNFTSGEPLEPPPNDLEAVSYLLWKGDGTYKVAEIAHHDVQQTP